MHLYQGGIPLSDIKDFLRHANANTTNIYASTDTSMMRAALEKVNIKDDEEMILKLCGLK